MREWSRMANIKLIGSSGWRRYQKMCAVAIREAERMGIPFSFEEVNDMEHLARLNPLNLPRLYINETLVASRNPPKSQEMAAYLQNAEIGCCKTRQP